MTVWTVDQLAKAAGLSEHQVRWHLRQGNIHGRKVRRIWLVEETEAKRFLAERKQELKKKLESMDV